MSKYASWVHGHTVQPQRESYALSKTRFGEGAVYQMHGGEWFHIAIPTPVIIDNIDTILKKVFVLYRTFGTPKIKSIHLWDGSTKIKAFDGLDLSGDHSNKLDQHNTWDVAPPIHIKWGLGVSVYVDFGPASKIGVPKIEFTSAGADFYTP